jgi:hypothetical protein
MEKMPSYCSLAANAARGAKPLVRSPEWAHAMALISAADGVPSRIEAGFLRGVPLGTCWLPWRAPCRADRTLRAQGRWCAVKGAKKDLWHHGQDFPVATAVTGGTGTTSLREAACEESNPLVASNWAIAASWAPLLFSRTRTSASTLARKSAVTADRGPLGLVFR